MFLYLVASSFYHYLNSEGERPDFLYVLDSNQNQIYKLNSTIVKMLLRAYKEELLSAYSEEPDIRNVFVMISYMDELNKK